jgi:outer membrane immunogenic protein
VAFNVGIDGLGGQGGAFTVGGGADYQFAPKFVIGAFVDYTRHNASTDINAGITDGIDSLGANIGFDIEDEISVGARLGYLANSRTLLYGTVGYSAVDISDARVSVSIDGFPLFNEVLARNGDFSGYFLGAGIETKLSDAVSLKLDYRYTDLGSERVTLLPDVFPEANEFVTTSLDTDIQTVRLTLNYRFDAVREAPAPLK